MKNVIKILAFILVVIATGFVVNNKDVFINNNIYRFGIDSMASFPRLTINDSLLIDGEMIYGQPHACFADTTNQTTISTTKKYEVKFSTNVHIDGDISHTAGDSIITINESGVYYISWSGIFASSAPNKTVNIWICKNNTPIPISNTIFQLLGTAQERLATVTYVVEFNSGDTFNICWQSNDTGMTLKSTGKQANPVRPTCPAIILTINKISD